MNLIQYSDIEFLLILFALVVLLFMGLTKKDTTDSSWIDLNTTNALKGIACVFILMGHYGQRMFTPEISLGGVSKWVWYLSANIALTWFMFFSGYGLSLKNTSLQDNTKSWWKRIKKIYIPLLVVSLATMVIYYVIPNELSVVDLKEKMLSQDIYTLRHLSSRDFWTTIVPHSLGWRDWYVCCILIFYSLFYFTNHLSIKFHINHSILLVLGLLVYFVWTYFTMGESQAHWYRYP